MQALVNAPSKDQKVALADLLRLCQALHTGDEALALIDVEKLLGWLKRVLAWQKEAASTLFIVLLAEATEDSN